MTVRSRDVLVLVLASLAGFSSPTAQDAPARPPTGLIVGQVIDAESGKPVGGATVVVDGFSASRPLRHLGRVPRILTTPEGYFVFRNLPAGSYGFAAEKPGYATGGVGRRRPDGPTRQITLKDGERIGDLVLRVWKYAAIGGTVIDEAGEPVVGIQTRCWRRAGTTGRWNACGVVGVTDDRGLYRLSGLLPGEYAIGTVSRPIAASARPSDGMARTSELMYGGRRGRGRGAPAVPPRQPGVPLLVYPLTFHPTARSADNAIVVAIGSGEDRGGIDLQLQAVPTVHVSGTLVTPDGPPRGTIVRLVPARFDDITLEQDALVTVTSSGGAFMFPAVPSGDYRLRSATLLRVPRKDSEPLELTSWADVPLTVGDTDIDDLSVALQTGLTISGRLEFDGARERPAPERLRQVPIVFESADKNPLIRNPPPSARNTGDGRFTSIGLSPGRYYVRVVSSPEGWMFKSAMHNGRDVSITPLEIRNDHVGGIVLNFTDRWTGLSGGVHSASGQPDEGALVIVFPTESDLWTDAGLNPRRTRGARANTTGAYNFTSLPQGSYYVVAIPDEDASDWNDPKLFEKLTGVATLVTIGDGEHRVQHLRTREVR